MKHLKLYEDYNAPYPPFIRDKAKLKEMLSDIIDFCTINDDGTVDIDMDKKAARWADNEVRQMGDDDDWFNDYDFYASKIEDQDYDAERTVYFDDILVDGFLPFEIRKFSGILYMGGVQLYSLRGFPKEMMNEKVEIYIDDAPFVSFGPLPHDGYEYRLDAANSICLGEHPYVAHLVYYDSPVQHEDYMEEFFRRLQDSGYDIKKIMDVLKYELPGRYEEFFETIPEAKDWVERKTKADKHKDIMDL